MASSDEIRKYTMPDGLLGIDVFAAPLHWQGEQGHIRATVVMSRDNVGGCDDATPRHLLPTVSSWPCLA